MLITNLKLCTRLSNQFFTSPQYFKVQKYDNLLLKNLNFNNRKILFNREFSSILIQQQKNRNVLKKIHNSLLIVNNSTKSSSSLLIWRNCKRIAKYSTKSSKGKSVASETRIKGTGNFAKNVKFNKNDVKRLFSLAKSEKLVLTGKYKNVK